MANLSKSWYHSKASRDLSLPVIKKQHLACYQWPQSSQTNFILKTLSKDIFWLSFPFVCDFQLESDKVEVKKSLEKWSHSAPFKDLSRFKLKNLYLRKESSFPISLNMSRSDKNTALVTISHGVTLQYCSCVLSKSVTLEDFKICFHIFWVSIFYL